MIHFIINPGSQSGRGIQQWKELKARLDTLPLPYDTYFTKSYEETVSYVASVTAFDLPEAFHQLAVLGGDGTVNEVINGVADRRRTCITYFPTGSGNDLARSLGLGKASGSDISRLFSMEHAIRTDLGYVRCWDDSNHEFQRYFAISCGIGFDAAACARSNHSGLKSFLNRAGLGKLIYLLNALASLLDIPDSDIRLTLDQSIRIRREKLMFCVSCVQKYEGGGFAFCPNTDNRDGRYDICLVHHVRMHNALYLIPMVKIGAHILSHRVNRYRAKELDIRTRVPLYVHTDGEVAGSFTHIQLSIPQDGTILFR